jgi:4-amino-4-deoxy-L-arabinose transferase-like glycosyltransferase
LLLVYLAVRIILLPPDPWISEGMSHDAAYLAMVARNLLAGKGFVLDALWLVFLQPDHLPMPFHNANPLYPISIALTSALTGWDVVKSGFLISAVSSVGVIVALIAILLRFMESPLRAAAIAFTVVLFPVVWDMSWQNVTDEFALMFLLSALAVLLRWDDRPLPAATAAGALFGLSWLARSMGIMAAPAIGVWILLRYGWRKAITPLLLFGAAAFVISLPWFLHNLHTWGDPFRSDNGYLASITYYYQHVNGAAVRSWFSPVKPLPLSILIRQHPGEIAKGWFLSLGLFFKVLVTGVTGPSYLWAAVLSLLTGGVLLLNWRSLLNREGVAFGVYAVTLFVLLSSGGHLMEARYFLPGYVLIVAWLCTSLTGFEWRTATGREGLVMRGCLILGAGCLVFGLVPEAIVRAEVFRQPDNVEKVPLMRVATLVNQTVSHGEPVVVGFHPYLYSLFTGAQALAIPQSDDAYLVTYMRKYHACCLLLSDYDIDFWRPTWRTSLPPHIVQVESIDQFKVYRLE